MRSEFTGNITAVRSVEDTVRATKKYTKGAFTRSVRHPIQGEEFPSKVLTEYYEIYPDTEVSWDMPAGVALDWLWGDVLHIDVLFQYDYRTNKAKVVVRGGNGVVDELKRGIPGFSRTLAELEATESRRTGNGEHKG